MYNSIIEFIEKDTTKIEKSIKESLLSGNMMRFEEKLLDTVIEFECRIKMPKTCIYAGFRYLFYQMALFVGRVMYKYDRCFKVW